LPRLRVRDIEINYKEEGKGEPLLLVHGLNGEHLGWAPVMGDLARVWRTIAVDLRGHGESGKPKETYSIRAFAEDLHAFLREMHIPRAHVMGHSMGGAIAQELALGHPEAVASLVLVATFSRPAAGLRRTFERLLRILREKGYRFFLDEVISLAFTPAYLAAHPGEIAKVKKRRLAINDGAAIARAARACLEVNLTKRIGAIRAPTLVLCGWEDRFTPVALSEEIVQAIPGSTMKVMEGVGHSLFTENPRGFLEIVRPFLEKNHLLGVLAPSAPGLALPCVSIPDEERVGRQG
jgi:3-oxoadipate enol-lactonase